MVMIAFTTVTSESSLVHLVKGLFAQIQLDLRSRYCVHIFFSSFLRKKRCVKRRSKGSQSGCSACSPLSIYAYVHMFGDHFCSAFVTVCMYASAAVHLDCFRTLRCPAPTLGLTSKYSTCSACVHTHTHNIHSNSSANHRGRHKLTLCSLHTFFVVQILF